MKIHRTPASLPSKPIAPPAQSPTSVAAQGESPVAISFPAKTVKPDSSAATSRAVDQLESTPTAAGSASTQLSFVERAAQIRGENFEALKQELRGKPLSFQLNRVNSFFNRNIRYTSDMKNQGQNDYWQTRSESLNLGKGDCEDYALAKYQTLKELGIPEKDLHVFYVKNKNNIAHMVLVHTNAEGKSVVLDNESSLVLPMEKRKDLKPVFGFNKGELVLANGPNGWLSGEHRPGPPNLKRFNDLLQRM